MKQVQALIAAVLITGMVALGMLVVGLNAALNTNTAPVSDSPASASSGGALADPPQGAIAPDQAQLNALQQQLDQANARLQQDESILNALQQRGIIQILPDGTVQLRVGAGGRR